MRLTRPPHPALRSFISAVWAVDDAGHERGVPASGRELSLPTSHLHIVFRLNDRPLRLFDAADDEQGREIGCAVVGGARASFRIKEVAGPLQSVGALLRPGAAQALLRIPAGELTARHVALAEIGWRADATSERLAEMTSLEERLQVLERALLARLPDSSQLHPAVAQAIDGAAACVSVRQLVSQSGYSHRAFVSLFRDAVGLTPKVFSRVMRFHRALEHMGASEPDRCVDVALRAGYSDQPHFTREFRDMAGVPPGSIDVSPRCGRITCL